MANIIKLKYGSGAPGANALQTGEVGLDLTNKVIYTADAGGNIIEMSRNMGEGGTIEWDQIINVPIQIENIINPDADGYVDLTTLSAQVATNKDDIAALKAWETVAKGEIAALQGQHNHQRQG